MDSSDAPRKMVGPMRLTEANWEELMRQTKAANEVLVSLANALNHMETLRTDANRNRHVVGHAAYGFGGVRLTAKCGCGGC